VQAVEGGGGFAIAGGSAGAIWCLWMCGKALEGIYVNWENDDGSITSVNSQDTSSADKNNDGNISKKELKAKRDEFNREVKPAFWRKEAEERKYESELKGGKKYTADDLARMRRGQPPVAKDGKSAELHHKEPLSQGGSNAFSNLKPLSRADHRGSGNYCRNHPHLCGRKT
jgi:hypothetical protein